jgi:hypothetical protein
MMTPVACLVLLKSGDVKLFQIQLLANPGLAIMHHSG